MDTVAQFSKLSHYDDSTGDLLQFSRDMSGKIDGAYMKITNWHSMGEAYALMEALKLTTFNGAPVEIELQFEEAKPKASSSKKKASKVTPSQKKGV